MLKENFSLFAPLNIIIGLLVVSIIPTVNPYKLYKPSKGIQMKKILPNHPVYPTEGWQLFRKYSTQSSSTGSGSRHNPVKNEIRCVDRPLVLSNCQVNKPCHPGVSVTSKTEKIRTNHWAGGWTIIQNQ